jgi:hypothetical protein
MRNSWASTRPPEGEFVQEEPMASIPPELRQEIEESGDQPVRIEDPRTQEKSGIVKEEIYERMRALLEEEEIDPSLFEYGDFEPL